MDFIFSKKLFVLPLFFFLASAYAGSSDIRINCQSESGKTSIYGFVPGDSAEYDLKIQIGDSTLQYKSGCVGVDCKSTVHKGNLYVIESLTNKVFTITLASNKGAEQGQIYAIPDTVKFVLGSNKFSANMQIVYYGIDPRKVNTQNTVSQYIEQPVLLTCHLKYKV